MSQNKWWGDFEFDVGQTRYWQLGQCLLCIERTSQMWRIAYRYWEKNTDQIKIAVDKIPGVTQDSFTFSRFSFQNTESKITLTPMLGNRSQVARPEFPFYISAFENVTLYVSSPAWIKIETGTPTIRLLEFSTLRLSDTWFGENTQEGELCYASRTRCRMELVRSELYSYRITSSIVIHNRSSENLLVQRIKMPLPSLSIYASQDNFLWTEDIIIENGSATGGMLTELGKTAPKLAEPAELLSGPRFIVKSRSIRDLFAQIL